MSRRPPSFRRLLRPKGCALVLALFLVSSSQAFIFTHDSAGMAWISAAMGRDFVALIVILAAALFVCLTESTECRLGGPTPVCRVRPCAFVGWRPPCPLRLPAILLSTSGPRAPPRAAA
jgi:hypothetical protein